MKRVQMKRGALCLAVLTGLSACASQHENMIRAGYPPGYAYGFEDGCHSGKRAGGGLLDQFKKDVRRFEADREYAQGWTDGYQQCRSEQEALERQNRNAIEQQKLYEKKRHDKWQEEHDKNSWMLQGIDTRGLEDLGKTKK